MCRQALLGHLYTAQTKTTCSILQQFACCEPPVAEAARAPDVSAGVHHVTMHCWLTNAARTIHGCKSPAAGAACAPDVSAVVLYVTMHC